MNTSQEIVRFDFGLASDVGRKRKGEPNQDAVKIILGDSNNWHPPLLIVADGLGGHRGGSVASQLVIQVFERQFKQTAHPSDYLKLMDLCARKAHTALRIHGSQDANLANMGSTIVAVVVENECVSLLNVGDSRAYISRGKNLIQISQDQTWVAEQVQAGILTQQEAQKHPKRNRLNMALTAKRPDIQPFTTKRNLEPDDTIILCSDGLWGVVPESLIWAALNELPLQLAADKLVDLANTSQGPDNISVIVARRFNPDRKPVLLSIEDTNPGM